MVPQLEVLSETSVFITHAGMGSTGEAVYYGVPMIAIPQMDEQMITAELIEHNGLGLSFPDKELITSSNLKAAIQKLLNDSSYRETAKAFSDDMKTLGGAKATADVIIAFLNR